MKKLFLFFTCSILLSYNSIGQNQPEYHNYYFTITNIDDPQNAKGIIDNIRKAIPSMVTFYFDDETDTFRHRTEKNYGEGEFINLLLTHHFQATEVYPTE